MRQKTLRTRWRSQSVRLGLSHVAAIVLVVLLAAGCELARPGEPVALVTGWGDLQPGSCYTNFATGTLLADPENGTGIAIETDPGQSFTVPVMWRPGFTARRIGDVIVVYDGGGKEIARTGRRYRLAGGVWAEPVTPTKENHYAFEGPSLFLACDSVTPV